MTVGSCAHTLYSRIPLQTSQAEDRAGGHCKAGEVSRIHPSGRPHRRVHPQRVRPIPDERFLLSIEL